MTSPFDRRTPRSPLNYTHHRHPAKWLKLQSSAHKFDKIPDALVVRIETRFPAIYLSFLLNSIVCNASPRLAVNRIELREHRLTHLSGCGQFVLTVCCQLSQTFWRCSTPAGGLSNAAAAAWLSLAHWCRPRQALAGCSCC